MSVTRFLVGIDEAGRGPLAGPVAVAAVSFNLERVPRPSELLRGIRDSKRLPVATREAWVTQTRAWRQEGLLDYRVALVGESIIDRLGIVPAVRLGLARALARLGLAPTRCQILLDGSLRAPAFYPDQTTIIRGDQSEPVIALASILAKVRRDRRMAGLAAQYAHYGFERHKGYGTRAHYQALRRYGPSPLHRRSFLKNFLSMVD
jgi:ribonuclease HII